MTTERRPAISAHRGGSEVAQPATLEAYRDSLNSGAEYAEFDIRRTADGLLVVYHDSRANADGAFVKTLTYDRLCEAVGYAVPLASEVMARISGRLAGHLDLKETGYERDVVGMATEILGVGGFVVTTLEDTSVVAIKRDFPLVRTALSLGRGQKDLSLSRAPGVRLSEMFPGRRVRACTPDGIAVHHQLTPYSALRLSASRNLFTMVWTVNRESSMRRFITDPRVDVLVTDRPRRAVAVRSSVSSGATGR